MYAQYSLIVVIHQFEEREAVQCLGLPLYYLLRRDHSSKQESIAAWARHIMAYSPPPPPRDLSKWWLYPFLLPEAFNSWSLITTTFNNVHEQAQQQRLTNRMSILPLGLSWLWFVSILVAFLCQEAVQMDSSFCSERVWQLYWDTSFGHGECNSTNPD